MTPSRRISGRLFLASWIAFAFFHQGGGWNQNARFATVRALVEEARFAIDDYLLYSHVEERDGDWLFGRTPIHDGVVDIGGQRYVLAWSEDPPTPVRPVDAAIPIALDRVAATGDLAFWNGHFYANKAPGVALLAAPGYFLLHHVERSVGLDPDAWWVLTVNAWLTSALSVALLSAFGCAALFQTLLLLWPERLRAATLATMTFAFGTLFFPYATMLFEQNVSAACLIGSFALLLRIRHPTASLRPWVAGTASGALIGLAVLSSYGAAIPGAMIVVWALLRPGGGRLAAWIVLGGAGPALLLAGFHQACFGSPFATSYAFQNPLFEQSRLLLGILGVPRPGPLWALLVSPYRGLFFSSPVLLAAVAGLWVAGRDPAQRAIALLCGAIAVVSWIANAAFEGWHAGWGVGPRYLVPALPFLAVGLCVAFARWPRVSGGLALVSVLVMTTFTVVDPQPPVGSSPIAARPDRDRLWRDPWSEYALPIFTTGRAAPILAARAREAGEAPPSSTQEALTFFRGPVSANPVGIYEAWIGRAFAPPAPQLAWNAFNAGELLLPESRLTPLLLAALIGPLLFSAWRIARDAEAAQPG